MKDNRRNFMKFALGAGAATGAGVLGACAQEKQQAAPAKSKSDELLDSLKPMFTDAKPISKEEHEARIERAQKLMVDNNIDAIFLDASTAMKYFVGMTWSQSERMTAAIIPAKGNVGYVTPAFEEAKVREIMKIDGEVRVWDEHESSYKQVAMLLDDWGIAGGNIGMEERVRYFLYSGIKKELPNATFVDADPVTIPLRMFKDEHELQLLKMSNEITIEVYKRAVANLEEGMTPDDFIRFTREGFDRMGLPGGRIWCSFGEATAFPHGSSQPQYLKKGDMVLMDGGVNFHGYRSDISRTIVFGNEPTDRQREIWDLEKKAQAAGFAAAILGDPQENIDIAARKVITDAGFGPGYQVPGLPHRTGHGIGMDGHEWGNCVLGNKTPLQPGMCFSIEPMMAIYGEFGVRLEDCAYMTEEGVKWFTEPSPSITEPFAT